MIKVSQMKSIPAGENPFGHDAFHMGQQIGKDLMLMMANHGTEVCKYLILVDLTTGERVRLDFTKFNKEKSV